MSVTFNIEKRAREINGTSTPPKPLYKNLVSPSQVQMIRTPSLSPAVTSGVKHMTPSTPLMPSAGPAPSNAVKTAGAPPKKVFVSTGKTPKKYDYSAYKSTSYDQTQMTAMLDNYVEVSKTEWANLPKGTHIRYMKKNGEFKPGGFVQNTYLLNGKQTIHCENGNDPKEKGYAKWPVVLENISHIWRLNNAPVMVTATPPTTVQSGLDKLDNIDKILQNGMEIRELQESQVRLTERIGRLEETVKAIVAKLKEKFGTQRQGPSPHPTANYQK
jgi:hypothetical protein